MQILINSNWIDFKIGKVIKKSNRQFYKEDKINDKSKIKIICDSCNKEHVVSFKKFKVRKSQNELCNDCSTQINRNKTEIKHKVKQTNLRRYGVENTFQYDEFKEKARQTNMNKYGLEKPNLYGSKEFRQNMTSKYGVDHPMKVKEFRDKTVKSNCNSKIYINKLGKEICYQSSYELNFIQACENLNIIVEDGPVIAYLFKGKEHLYISDFKIGNFIIEIKGSHHWYKEDVKSGLQKAKNNAAIDYCIDNGKEFKFLLDIKNIKDYEEVINELYDE